MKNIVPAIGILVFDEDKVLLVQHGEGAEHLTGIYGIPSGRLEENESEIDAAKREMEEETGLKCSIADLVGYPNNVYFAKIERKHGTDNFKWTVFICKKSFGSIHLSEETKPEWVKISDINKLKLLPNIGQAVKDGLEFLKNEN